MKCKKCGQETHTVQLVSIRNFFTWGFHVPLCSECCIKINRFGELLRIQYSNELLKWLHEGNSIISLAVSDNEN